MTYTSKSEDLRGVESVGTTLTPNYTLPSISWNEASKWNTFTFLTCFTTSPHRRSCETKEDYALFPHIANKCNITLFHLWCKDIGNITNLGIPEFLDGRRCHNAARSDVSTVTNVTNTKHWNAFWKKTIIHLDRQEDDVWSSSCRLNGQSIVDLWRLPTWGNPHSS